MLSIAMDAGKPGMAGRQQVGLQPPVGAGQEHMGEEAAVTIRIAAEPAQIEAAVQVGAPVIEIHTGTWCDAVVAGEAAKAEAEFDRIVRGAA